MKTALSLTIFTIISIALVSYTKNITQQQISENIRANTLEKIHEIISPTQHDNDILQSKKEKSVFLHDITQTITIYRATKNNQLVGLIIKHTYPKGYSGNILLLTGVDTKQKILGVRVIEHQETPGLGDRIETIKSNWIKSFNGLSLKNPKIWKVKKDGGSFDAFTGATITPRAIVNANYELLIKISNNELK
ncbi:Electron transport complex protein RnfG [hydrothermal vent metagenome]|uniref:Electron transport complex protein RnfG n=1 Tax=hydrothermal vent metagenome TaxID=652676 RepID=A0A1W1CQF2_9ZZZZ